MSSSRVREARQALRLRVARHLETGGRSASTHATGSSAPESPVVRAIAVASRGLARIHAPIAARTIARPLVVPPGSTVVCVGGATLGGSGKTRVALASAMFLAERGVRVALIGHAYGASPSVARVVAPSSNPAEVGDEALACARTLARSRVAARVMVVVAKTRATAFAFVTSLAERPDVVVIDGPLQLRPVRAALSLLAVDARAPWGAGLVAPAGDLRAPKEALLAAADLVVPVDATPDALVVVDDDERPLSSIRHARVGLFTALARPDRLERALRDAGIEPVVTVACPDHGPVSATALRALAAGDAHVDLWLATEKCMVHLEAANPRRPRVQLSSRLTLPTACTEALLRLAPVLARESGPAT